MTRSAHAPQRSTARALTDAELAQLRVMLEQQRGFRLEQLAELEHPGTQGPRSPLGSADGEIAASLAVGAHAALRDVTAALERMATGRYGRCTACATPLAIERLEILPQVELCMDCQRADVRATGAGPCRAVAGGVGSPA